MKHFTAAQSLYAAYRITCVPIEHVLGVCLWPPKTWITVPFIRLINESSGLQLVSLASHRAAACNHNLAISYVVAEVVASENRGCNWWYWHNYINFEFNSDANKHWKFVPSISAPRFISTEDPKSKHTARVFALQEIFVDLHMKCFASRATLGTTTTFIHRASLLVYHLD